MNIQSLSHDMRDLLIFDCDPGCDDALAIALMLKARKYKRIDFLAVGGNVSVQQTTNNLCRLLSLLRTDGDTEDAEINVFKGCKRSLTGRELPASDVHGRDGMGDVPWLGIECQKPFYVPSVKLHAVDRLRKLSEEKEKFDLLCTGPLTNLAMALAIMNSEQEQRFWELADRIVLMGGNFEVTGNITPVAEFNIFHDPVAAQIVLDSWKKSTDTAKKINGTPCNLIHFVPLDVTERMVLDLDQEPIKNAKCHAAMFLRAILKPYGRFHATAATHPGCDRECYKARDIEVFKDQFLGGSGFKKYQPFCQVHDALAAWALLYGLGVNERWDEFAWSEKSEIRIDTSLGDARGHIFEMGSKSKPFSSLAPELGTRVRWLKPAMNEEISDNARQEEEVATKKSEVILELERILEFKSADEST